MKKNTRTERGSDRVICEEFLVQVTTFFAKKKEKNNKTKIDFLLHNVTKTVYFQLNDRIGTRRAGFHLF